MVKYFHYHVLGEDPFDDKLISKRCNHFSANEVRCKKRCMIGLGKCWIHLLSDNSLRIKKSNFLTQKNINGLGLYAMHKDPKKRNGTSKIFKKKKLICHYNGEVIDQATLDDRYTEEDYTAPYAVSFRKKNGIQKYEDAALLRGVGSLINHTDNQGQVNCKLKQFKNKIIIEATKDIKDGTELLTNYGNAYLLNEANVRTSTNNRKLHV